MAARGVEIRSKSSIRHRGATRRSSAGRLGTLLEGSETHPVVRRGVAGHATGPELRQTGFPRASAGAGAG